jgi:hypothetical protein
LVIGQACSCDKTSTAIDYKFWSQKVRNDK